MRSFQFAIQRLFIRLFFLSVSISFCACSGSTGESGDESATVNTKENKVNNAEIIGVWSDGKTENATFEIKPGEIIYVDAQESYPYEFTGDSLFIHFQEEDFRYAVKKVNDTLILTNQEFGATSFHRFTE